MHAHTAHAGTMEAHLHSYASLVPLQPDFLAPNWFIIENVTALRLHLKYLVFKHMLEQVRRERGQQPVLFIRPQCFPASLSLTCK
eukprot:1160466-Pelagomonas_calceolata.AAC.3